MNAKNIESLVIFAAVAFVLYELAVYVLGGTSALGNIFGTTSTAGSGSGNGIVGSGSDNNVPTTQTAQDPGYAGGGGLSTIFDTDG